MHMTRLLAGILTTCVLMPSPLAAQTYETATVRDTTGYPHDPQWVNGGDVMSVRYNTAPGNNYNSAGIRITVTQPIMIDRIAGVMGSGGTNVFTSPTTTIHLNIFSNEDLFGEHIPSPHNVGDVYSDTDVYFILTDGLPPPLWGGQNALGVNNRWVEFGFEPFLLQPGSYILAIQVFSGGLIAWTETLNPLGIPSDIATGSSFYPDWIEFLDLSSSYTTGNPAVLIQGKVEVPQCPIPADLNCDGVVNVSDLLILLGDWGACTEPDACPADLNDDGVVNVSDLLLLLSNWG